MMKIFGYFCVVVALLWTDQGIGKDRYYVVIYGYQNALNTPGASHTFGTFIQVRGEDPNREIVERNDISWLPADFAKTYFLPGFKTVPGKNYSLEETLEFAKSPEVRAEARPTGAFEISEKDYVTGKNRAEALNAGGLSYLMIDPTGGQPKAFNCIRALRATYGSLETGLSWGWAASNEVEKHFRNKGVITGSNDPMVVDLLEKKLGVSTVKKPEGNPRKPSPKDTAGHF